MLTPIQALLIAPLLFLIGLQILRLRRRRLMSAALILVAMLGVVLVLVPDSTTAVARSLNVGRGTDLLFYFGAIAGFLALVSVYARLRKLETEVTAIVRSLALQNARRPD